MVGFEVTQILMFYFSTNLYFKKKTEFPIKVGREREKMWGKGRAGGRERDSTIQTAASGPPGRCWGSHSVVWRSAQTRPLLSQLIPSPSTEHTQVCHFWFHSISILPSGWWPWSPLGNLHTGSHGYPQFPDRRLLRADGSWHWEGNRLGVHLSHLEPCIFLFTPSPAHCPWRLHARTHARTHTPLSLDHASFWPSQMLQQLLTFIEYQLSSRQWPTRCFSYKREGNNLPGQIKEFRCSEPI